jgi:predicted outer membrane lipoprotein
MFTQNLGNSNQRRYFVNIKSQKDFFSGLVYVVAGAAFAIGATNYSVGTGARMGPGYFPLLLGVLLAIIGAFVMFKALTVETQNGDKIGSWAWKPLFFIIAGNLLFGILLGGLPSIGLPPMGLIAAIFGTTLVVSRAGDVFNLKEVLILATILSIGSYAAFVLLLKLQFPVWPTFITG